MNTASTTYYKDRWCLFFSSQNKLWSSLCRYLWTSLAFHCRWLLPSPTLLLFLPRRWKMFAGSHGRRNKGWNANTKTASMASRKFLSILWCIFISCCFSGRRGSKKRSCLNRIVNQCFGGSESVHLVEYQMEIKYNKCGRFQSFMLID